jgi:hypothetical protein
VDTQTFLLMKDQRASGDKVMTAKFDQWLEDELSRTLTPIVSEPARPGQACYQTAGTGRLSIGRKAVIGLAVATMVVAGSGVLAAASGSVNPQVWGQQVIVAVENCKTELQPGHHGIGACVSAFARQHGEQMQTQHGANGANGAAGVKHGGSHPGPPWLRQQASPQASATANP